MNIETIPGYVRKARVDEGQEDSSTVYVFCRGQIMVYLHVYDDGNIGLISEDFIEKRMLMNKAITQGNIGIEIGLALSFGDDVAKRDATKHLDQHRSKGDKNGNEIWVLRSR